MSQDFSAGKLVLAWAIATCLLAPRWVVGQQASPEAATTPTVTQTTWQQRVLGQNIPAATRPADPRTVGGRTRSAPVQHGRESFHSGTLGQQANVLLPASARSMVRTQAPVQSQQGEPIVSEEPIPLMEGEIIPPGAITEPYDSCGEGCGFGPDACDPDPCWFAPGCVAPWWWDDFASYWLCGFEVFAGVHGFKGPADRGRNGNFGFHEGINFGAPLGDPWGMGYQAGFQAVHSNFSGDQTLGLLSNSDRDQFFFTGGIFHRKPAGGVQWGVVYDYLHDSYHGTADLSQIRAEMALVWPCRREFGFWGAFSMADGRFGAFSQERQAEQLWDVEPLDVYALFYRRYFSAGGRGRVWTGVTGEGDALLGADLTVPLGTNWALENNFTYLIPKEGHGQEAQTEETWSVSIQLVWYPGRSAVAAVADPFHPLISVADNSQFLLRRP